jgi:hypothetical protein
MKTAKFLSWDEIDHESGFICLPFHPEAKGTDVFQFQPKEPSVKPISVVPMLATIPGVSTVHGLTLHRIEIQTQNPNRAI